MSAQYRMKKEKKKKGEGEQATFVKETWLDGGRSSMTNVGSKFHEYELIEIFFFRLSKDECLKIY